MGFEIKFNWALQIDCKDELVVDNTYDFSKKGNRVFPIGVPIDLIDLERSAIAKVRVLEFLNVKNETKGKFSVVKIYSGNEKEVLTDYWIENQ